MPTYRTPLPRILAATLETAVNQLLAMDEGSARRLGQLNRRLVRLELDGIGIVLDFSFSPYRVKVSVDAEGTPDTVISGTPAALFAMAIPDEDGSWGRPGSQVRIAGDATLARDVERLFSRLDPDWEAKLSAWFGDVAGYQLAAGAREANRHMRSTVATLGDFTADFLRQPSSPLAQPAAIAEFGHAVDALRDATDRLEARLRILRESKAQAAGMTGGSPQQNKPERKP
jgi:ubiquinone biosynthesis accessory factor UbiJ